uniref:Uncharacterized protein n=1 Tax=Rhizophora mucronata TaxID=61149 RepID=A0A2P2Q793_RHIMU
MNGHFIVNFKGQLHWPSGDKNLLVQELLAIPLRSNINCMTWLVQMLLFRGSFSIDCSQFNIL